MGPRGHESKPDEFVRQTLIVLRAAIDRLCNAPHVLLGEML